MSVRVLLEDGAEGGFVIGGNGCAVATVETGASGGAAGSVGGAEFDGLVNILGHCAVISGCSG